MNDDLVSIIIPVYNSAKYIKETIESIEKQSYKNYEAIFVDDKSLDGSLEIIKEYGKNNNRIKIVELNKHRGVSKARNIGIRLSKGRYLTFLDSDDVWLENKLERQINFIKNNNYEFVYCSFKYMNDNGTKISKTIKTKKETNYNQTLKDCRISTITTMIDLEKIPKRYCYMPDVINEDIITWWKILKKGYKAYGQNEVLAYYRQTKNSRSSKKYMTALYRWRAYRKIEKLSLLKTIYYFICYATNATIRRIGFMKYIERFKEVQVCISTQNLENDAEVNKLLNKMNVNSNYLIINQTQNENVNIKNEKVITKNEKGLSKSRNAVIENATSDIIMLADDDVVYDSNYEKYILNAHNKYPDYDIICFYIKSKNQNRKIKRIITRRVNWINAMRVASVEISFKRDSIINANIRFNENFGTGTELNRGEETIFLYEALRKKIKIKFINKKVGEVDQSESSWFTKYDKDFFNIQGKVFKEMSPKHYKLLSIQYAIRKYHIYHKDISFLECLNSMLTNLH